MHLADVTFPDWHPLHGETGAVLAFALRHPTGLLLFETGIGAGNKFIDGAAYAVIDGDVQIAAGVRVLSTPGHSPGHQSVVFDTADGAVVLAGQAIYSRAEYDLLEATNSVSDADPPPEPEQYLASAARLMQLRPRRVHFSHDTAVWEP